MKLRSDYSVKYIEDRNQELLDYMIAYRGTLKQHIKYLNKSNKNGEIVKHIIKTKDELIRVTKYIKNYKP